MINQKERYERIFSFMRRNAHVVGYEKNLKWMTKYYPKSYTDEQRKNMKQKLETAKKTQKELADRVFEDMNNGVINHTTQGIWFSYKKSFKRLDDLQDKSRRYIMTLETGEKFVTERKYQHIPCCSSFLGKMKIISLYKV